MSAVAPLFRPNVRTPAPLIMAFALLIGTGLNSLWPMQLDAPVARNIAGWAYNLAATGLLAWCFVLFIRRRTTIIPNRPVSAFVTEGPYRFSRNPMYLALALFHLGIAMASGVIWNVFTFVPAMIAIRIWVIAPEERYMLERFGALYRNYFEQVPRWF